MLTNQVIGRIHRRGQTRHTFIFQLMAAKTVDTLHFSAGPSDGIVTKGTESMVEEEDIDTQNHTAVEMASLTLRG